MIPILYEAIGPLLWGNVPDFSTNGICRLGDCISCTVTEERNGIYECQFQYPASGKYFEEIRVGRVIYVDVNEDHDKQPFVIYYISKPISGVVTYYANHISYSLNETIIAPCSASGTAAQALSAIASHILTGYWFPWTFWTDITASSTFSTDVPVRGRSALFGMEGSILDHYGGEYEFDMFNVKLYENRGSDNGVWLRYGKNITDITDETDALDIYNGAIAYWTDGEGTTVYTTAVTDGPIIQHGYWTADTGIRMEDDAGVEFDFYYSMPMSGLIDMTDEFDTQPTEAQLKAAAVARMNAEQTWVPKRNIKVDFVSLSETEEYRHIAPLESVKLCDTVHVYYPDLMIEASAKVIKTVFNVLLGKYDKVEIGMAKPTLHGTIV